LPGMGDLAARQDMIPEHANLRHDDNPLYLSGEGLLNEPFADNAAGHFFYAGADGAQRLDLMLHLAPYSPLLVIAGKPGVGKTALLRQFVARANDTWRIAVVTARVDMGRDELLRDMARGFGLSLDTRIERQALYVALVTQLRALRQNAQAPILLLDDAQYLSATMMELLFNLCAENDAGHILSIVLFGTPQLQNLLESSAQAALAARVTHTFEITPFTEQETGDYIRHRLRAAGATDDGPFDAMLINKIHAVSGGVAARINEIARQELEVDKTLGVKDRKAGRSDSSKKGSTKRSVLIAAVVVVVALMVAGPLRNVFFKATPPASNLPQQAKSEKLPPPLTVGEEERVIRPVVSETVPVMPPPPPSSAPESVVSSQETVKTLPLPPISPVTEKAPVPAAEVAPPMAVPTASPPQTLPPAALQTKQAVTPEVVKPQIAKAKPAVHPAASGAIRGEEWIRAQPEDRFTLQLMAVKEEKTARQFIEIHHLQDKAAYIPVRHDGQVLYTLVYGDYATRGEAERAAKQMPAKWGAPNPWIRSFKSLRSQPGN
jgi:type II secretory pathway predicted ATPase ExeA